MLPRIPPEPQDISLRRRMNQDLTIPVPSIFGLDSIWIRMRGRPTTHPGWNSTKTSISLSGLMSSAVLAHGHVPRFHRRVFVYARRCRRAGLSLDTPMPGG